MEVGIGAVVKEEVGALVLVSSGTECAPPVDEDSMPGELVDEVGFADSD